MLLWLYSTYYKELQTKIAKIIAGKSTELFGMADDFAGFSDAMR